MMQLAFYVGEPLGLAPRDLQLVRTAGLLSALGRTREWRYSEPHHHASARLADSTLRESSTPVDDRFREEVCFLISHHCEPPGEDRRLQALWDAECYETARFAPDTDEGRRAMDAGMRLVVTPWAKYKDHQLRWARFRKWQTL
jgi:hypothetical protein